MASDREVTTKRARAAGERFSTAMNESVAARARLERFRDRVAARLVTRRARRYERPAGRAESRNDRFRRDATGDLREAVEDSLLDERRLSVEEQIEKDDRHTERADRAQGRGAPPGIV